MKEKLRKYADYKGISHRKFSMDLGKSDKYIDAKGSLSVDLLPLIRNKFPDLSIDWLVFGEGKMISNKDSSSNVSESEVEYGKNYKQLYYEVLEDNRILNNENRSLRKKIDSIKKEGCKTTCKS